MDKIEQGDQVRHTDKVINGGLIMSVIDVDNNRALCGHFLPDEDRTLKEEWFDFDQLTLVHKADGGFKDAGEGPTN